MFFMSYSFTNKNLAQVELWEGAKSGRYENGVQNMPKALNEKVARLNSPKIDTKLTILSLGQADYIATKVEGPYKLESYQY